MSWPTREQVMVGHLPPEKDDPEQIDGWVKLPCWRCLRCGYKWLGITGIQPIKPCRNCGDWNWHLPRLAAPIKTSRRSKHDKRTLG